MSTEEFFLHGGCYQAVLTETRPACCGSCAFTNSPDTVRPTDVTLIQLERWTRDYDGFVCHEPCGDGQYRECAGWHARFGR